MEKPGLKRWMVALDLTEMDGIILEWISYLSMILQPKTIYFVHVVKDLELPEYIPEELKDSIQAADEGLKSTIKKRIDENFISGAIETKIEVLEGKAPEKLLRSAKVKKIDLFVAGNKERSKGSGSLSQKVTRKLSCQVLIVPPIAKKNISNILVPIDFSNHSKIAVETAFSISDKLKDASIKCLHIYEIPLGFYKTGKSKEEFAEIMKVNSTKQYDRFMKSFDRSADFDCVLLDKGPASELINNEILKDKIDLVIMGSKGQSAGSLILLGSTTEKLTEINETSLTLIVKKKDEHIGFFEAFGKI